MISVDNVNSCDVLVVGFGPAGAVAAGLLGRLGHRVMVVERLTEIYDRPRAIALDHEIFRHFDDMGLAEAIAQHVEPFTASQHFGADGQLIRRIDMVPPPYPLGYTPSMVFTQPPVEAVLRDHAASFANVDVTLGVELVHLAHFAEGVTATLKDSDSTSHTVTARYVLGCDGASSTVRQLAGIGLQDLIFDEPWLVVDVLVCEAALSKLPQTSAQFCNPARPTSFIIGPKNHRRWEIMLLPGEDPREMERSTTVWQLLSPWLLPSDGELWRAAAYRFHALVADDWRRGRILIAGDAAHQQPPFIGQGMCQGLRDVTNLVWKLDRVLKRSSSEALLDSYTAERKRHVTELTGKIKAIGEAICERDPVAARARDKAILAEGDGTPRSITRQEIVPPLRTGFLSRREAPARGTLFPQPMIVDRNAPRLLDKIIGGGWRLIVDGRNADIAAAAPHLAATLPELVVATVADKPGADILVERDGVLAGWFDHNSASAALVRPDHYVFGTAADIDTLVDLVGEVTQRLQSDDRP